MLGYELRNYQNVDLSQLKEDLAKYDKVLYQLPTGGGKTVVLSQIVCDLLEEGKKFLILVHKERLLGQIVQTLKANYIYTGSIIRNKHINLDAMVIVASVKTVMRKNRIHLIENRDFDYVIIDEAHHSPSSSYQKVLEVAGHTKLLGVTATPYRSDNKNLVDYYDFLRLSSKTVKDLISENFLCDYKLVSTPIHEIKNVVGLSGKDYKQSDLSKYMRDKRFLNYILESYKKHALDRLTIIFCVDVAHAKSLMQTFEQDGLIENGYIDASTNHNEREQIIENFQKGTIKRIFCIETLTEGVDIPECTCVQLARPTLSIILYLQMVGRGLRPKPDGGNCIIIDNAGTTQEFGMPDSDRNWQLDSGKNPIVPGDKILVGEDEDGNLTDDFSKNLNNIQEMDYEDFIAKTLMTEEEARKINKNIDDGNKTKFQKIVTTILEEAKVKNDLKVALSKYSEQEATLSLKDNSEKIIIRKEDNNLAIKTDYSWSSSYNINTTLNQAKINTYVGKISQVYLDQYPIFLEQLQEISKKESRKIDIISLTKAINKREQELLENKVTTAFERGENFEIKVDDEGNWNIRYVTYWVKNKVKEGQKCYLKILSKKLTYKKIEYSFIDETGKIIKTEKTDREEFFNMFKFYNFNL